MRLCWLIACVCAVVISQAPAVEVPYQARVELNGTPFVGDLDLRLTAWNDPVAGTQFGSAGTATVTGVVDGLVSTSINIPGLNANELTTRNLWLEVEVRRVGDAGFITLSGRQPLQPVPAAEWAANAGLANNANFANTAGFANDGPFVRLQSTQPGSGMSRDASRIFVQLPTGETAELFPASPIDVLREAPVNGGPSVPRSQPFSATRTWDPGSNVRFRDAVGVDGQRSSITILTRSTFGTEVEYTFQAYIISWYLDTFDPTEPIEVIEIGPSDDPINPQGVFERRVLSGPGVQDRVPTASGFGPAPGGFDDKRNFVLLWDGARRNSPLSGYNIVGTAPPVFAGPPEEEALTIYVNPGAAGPLWLSFLQPPTGPGSGAKPFILEGWDQFRQRTYELDRGDGIIGAFRLDPYPDGNLVEVYELLVQPPGN